MMLEKGDCDAVLSGVTSEYPAHHPPGPADHRSEAGGNPGVRSVRADQKDSKIYLFADTTVNINPTAEELAEIAICSAEVARRFNMKPRIAMLSFSNFGSAPYAGIEQGGESDAAGPAAGAGADGRRRNAGSTPPLMPEYMKKHFPFSRSTKRPTCSSSRTSIPETSPTSWPCGWAA